MQNYQQPLAYSNGVNIQQYQYPTQMQQSQSGLVTGIIQTQSTFNDKFPMQIFRGKCVR